MALDSGLRHAQVLPSFAVAFIARTLPCHLGALDGHDLLAWERIELPSKATACELRDLFVQRRRSRFDEVWNSITNVHVDPRWRESVTSLERERLQLVLRDESSISEFPKLTFRQVKESLRMTAADALGLLAKLEALYWIPRLDSHADVARELVACDANLKTRMARCLQQPWVQELSADDLRFPQIDGMPLHAWVTHQLESPAIAGSVLAVCNKLDEAAQATWGQELADVALTGIKLARRRPKTADGLARWQAIFMARYGGSQGLELQKVGLQFGLTRERVRQICDVVLDALRNRQLKMPALERVLAMAARIMPLPIAEVDDQLAPYLGEGFGVSAAMQFAQEFGLESPVKMTAPKARTSAGIKVVPLVDSSATPATWLPAALSLARRDCTFVGCTNLLRIAGFLSLDHGIAIDSETLKALFTNAPGFRLLDAQAFWFTLADSDESAIALRMRKLLSVATMSVGLDAVVTALATEDRWLHKDDARALTLPPLHVLAKLFAGWSWLQADGHNKYAPTQPLNPAELLSKSELGAVEAIQLQGGVATRAEIAAYLMRELKVSNVTVSLVTATSMAICKLEHALYGIQGRPLPVEALIAARSRRAIEQCGAADLPPVDLNRPITVQVTQSGATDDPRRHVVYLPKYLEGQLLGEFESEDPDLPAIVVKPNNQVRGLAAAAYAKGVGRRMKFDVTFDAQARTYAISGPSQASLLAA